MILFSAIFWCILAILFAVLEIEIMGKHGWAERLPTWYRVTGWPARLFTLLNGGRPLSGYHLYMLAITLMIFHVGLFQGAPWDLPRELQMLAIFFAWVPTRAFIAIALNPDHRFGQHLWWYAREPWFNEMRMPLSYLLSGVLSWILAIAASAIKGSADILAGQLLLVVVFNVICIPCVLLADHYKYWRCKMLGQDERHLVKIFHDGDPYDYSVAKLRELAR